MSDVNDGDVLRLGAGLIYDGLYDVVNVYHVEVEAPGGETWEVITPFIQTYLDDLYDNIKTQLNDTMGTGSISVANMTQATTLGSIAWSPGWAGAESGEPTASGVCCFTWARTHKPRVQLRKYLGVFGEVNVVAGAWTSTVQDACEALMAEHIEDTFMGGSTRFQGVAYNRLLATFERGYSTDKSAEPAYQRRRKRGRGS